MAELVMDGDRGVDELLSEIENSLWEWLYL